MPTSRRPGVAALLSLVAGAGHLYVGRPRAAIRIVVVDLAANVLSVLLLFRGLVAALSVTFLVYVAWRIAVAVSAWRAAREAPTQASWLVGRRLTAAVITFVLARWGIHEGGMALSRATLGETYRIPSGAMAPTLLAGDYLVASRTDAGAVERGDIRVARDARGEVVIKRIVGLPGDTIAMRDGLLSRNGVPTREPYVRRDSSVADFSESGMLWQRSALSAPAESTTYLPTYFTWGPLVVPDGRLFVLGDNRSNSMDSRLLGFVESASVSHRPILVYFSRDPAGGVRWERIGRTRIE